MKILIELEAGKVKNVWCENPDGAEVFMRDLDMVAVDPFTEDNDPLVAIPGLRELRVPHFVIY